MRKHLIYLLIASLCAVVLATTIGAWKLSHFSYNALDLGIYSQVAWNISHGNGFDSSIQNTNYAGDHLEPILIPFAYIMRLFPSALTLIVLQAIALFATSLIVYHLAREYVAPTWALMIGGAFLLHPLLWNAALFEFHALSFSLPLLCLSCLFFKKNNYYGFISSTLALLLVREDMALILIGWGIFALLKKRPLLWWLPNIFAGIAWFIISMTIAHIVNPDGYKFFVYYGWLGNSLNEIAQTVITRPWYVISGMFSLNHLLLAVALLLLFFGLPLFSLSLLIPAAGILAQLFFAQFDTGVVMTSHYTIPLVPFLAWAAIVSIAKIRDTKKYHILHAQTLQPLWWLISGAVIIYSFVVVGPVLGSIRHIVKYQNNTQDVAINAMLNKIPDTASVYASYGLLPHVALREHVYALHYVPLGKKQFSQEPYIAKPLPEYLLLDLTDLSIYETQLAQGEHSKAYATTHERLRMLLDQYIAAERIGNIIRYQKTDTPNHQYGIVEKRESENLAVSPLGPVMITEPVIEQSVVLGKNIVFDIHIVQEKPDSGTPYAFEFSQHDTMVSAPFGWNIYPLHALHTGETIRMRVPFPDTFTQQPIQISLVTRTGSLQLNELRSAGLTRTSTVIASKEATLLPLEP